MGEVRLSIRVRQGGPYGIPPPRNMRVKEPEICSVRLRMHAPQRQRSLIVINGGEVDLIADDH